MCGFLQCLMTDGKYFISLKDKKAVQKPMVDGTTFARAYITKLGFSLVFIFWSKKFLLKCTRGASHVYKKYARETPIPLLISTCFHLLHYNTIKLKQYVTIKKAKCWWPQLLFSIFNLNNNVFLNYFSQITIQTFFQGGIHNFHKKL